MGNKNILRLHVAIILLFVNFVTNFRQSILSKEMACIAIPALFIADDRKTYEV
jgi:hypothetical protein